MARKNQTVEEIVDDQVEKDEFTPADDIIPTVTEEDKLNFFKAFLSDVPFMVEEILLGGAMKIKFKSLTTEENMDIFDQLRAEQVAGTMTNDANYTTQLASYRLALSLKSINDLPFEGHINKTSYSSQDGNYVVAKAKVIKSWPVFKLAAFAEAFKAFEEKLIYLTRETQTENFWPAVT